jgi:hypothetical protein
MIPSIKTISDIKLLLFNLTNSVRLVEGVITDNELKYSAKEDMNRIKRLVESAIKEVETKVGHEKATVIRKEITENYETGSVMNILYNAVNMNDQQRNVYDEVGTAIINQTFRVHTEFEFEQIVKKEGQIILEHQDNDKK